MLAVKLFHHTHHETSGSIEYIIDAKQGYDKVNLLSSGDPCAPPATRAGRFSVCSV